jgi:hypothetical protein
MCPTDQIFAVEDRVKGSGLYIEESLNYKGLQGLEILANNAEVLKRIRIFRFLGN